jgi:hypothetical protein
MIEFLNVQVESFFHISFFILYTDENYTSIIFIMSSNSSHSLINCISSWSKITFFTFLIIFIFTYILLHNSSRRIYKFIWYTYHKNTSAFFIRKIISLTKSSSTNCKKNRSFLTTLKIFLYFSIFYLFISMIFK